VRNLPFVLNLPCNGVTARAVIRSMIIQRTNTLAILDIGSSKFVCVIGRIGQNNVLQILGVGHRAANGVRSGIITDIGMAAQALKEAIGAAEIAANERIRTISVNLSSNVLLSQRASSELNIVGREITYKELDKLMFDNLQPYQKQQLNIIHSFAFDYTLDGKHGINNPLGMYGNTLVCDTHIVASPSNLLLNIFNCVYRCKVDVTHYVSSAYATGLACLTSDEKKFGVVLIEFGGGSTSISIFENNQMIFTDGIPIGGIVVTHDVAKGLRTTFAHAERIKTLYGGVFATTSDNDEMIEVPLTDEWESDTVLISRNLLIEIMSARIEEIIELVMLKLKDSHLQYSNRIVITGGGAQVPGLKELVSETLVARTRIGGPQVLQNMEYYDPSFATATGMMMHAMDYSLDKKQTGTHRKGFLKLIQELIDGK